MDGTFHCFGDLPPELRDAIWKAALRPTSQDPLVFKIYDTCVEGSANNMSELARLGNWWTTTHLGAPCDCSRCGRGVGVYTRDNMAQHLADTGMWTACREASRVVRRHYGLALVRGWINMNPRKTGYFMGPNGDANFFTTLPGWDLFLIETRDLARTSERFWDSRLGRLFSQRPQWDIDDVKNIGFEFGQCGSWAIQCPGREAIMEALFRLATKTFSSPVHFWIVDSSLVLTSHEATEEGRVPRDGKTFYDRDRRLVELNHRAEHSSSARFVLDINDMIDDAWSRDYRLRYVNRLRRPLRFKLLGCTSL